MRRNEGLELIGVPPNEENDSLGSSKNPCLGDGRRRPEGLELFGVSPNDDNDLLTSSENPRLGDGKWRPEGLELFGVPAGSGLTSFAASLQL